MSAALEWPPIANPKLVERLALDDGAFDELVEKIGRLVPARAFGDAELRHALGYPWQRPERSYIFRAGEVEPLGDPLGGLPAGRIPLLAYGSNASPEGLARKLVALAPQDQEVYVLLGALAGFDVGASAHTAAYGALPATLFESPGAAVDCAVLLVTPEQLEAIAWPEINYAFGALAGVEFTADLDCPRFEQLFAFISRRGAYAPGGEALAMSAVGCAGRSATSASQRELLALAATAVLGPEATPEQLVATLLRDYAPTARAAVAALKPSAIAFSSASWTPYPA